MVAKWSYLSYFRVVSLCNSSAMATNKPKISSYIQPELLPKAKRLAKLEGKTLSGFVESLLDSAVCKAESDGIVLEGGK